MWCCVRAPSWTTTSATRSAAACASPALRATCLTRSSRSRMCPARCRARSSRCRSKRSCSGPIPSGRPVATPWPIRRRSTPSRRWRGLRAELVAVELGPDGGIEPLHQLTAEPEDPLERLVVNPARRRPARDRDRGKAGHAGGIAVVARAKDDRLRVERPVVILGDFVTDLQELQVGSDREEGSLPACVPNCARAHLVHVHEHGALLGQLLAAPL